ncbi:hypothetical protein NE0114 [Nitrosomonas europaea ATCC 19718]|uniref:Uncharacterized protein n=1 Tax=Nitrosomonas europaea (strain ATCC 19718 / CIP 103999 / KCTC 2705 / NBRC 14298) TaxID=228410 RepID=Q82XX8_NITEU|nr:hypothetical protein NE0114 [Nitrosomonas europaea ATCC 19718]
MASLQSSKIPIQRRFPLIGNFPVSHFRHHCEAARGNSVSLYCLTGLLRCIYLAIIVQALEDSVFTAINLLTEYLPGKLFHYARAAPTP